MKLPDYNSKDTEILSQRFCNLLWHDSELEFWLDVSRIDINEEDLSFYNTNFNHIFQSMQLLEEGAIANPDENRQVGHYWLRNPILAPSQEIAKSIEKQIEQIELFSKQIVNGKYTSKNNNKFENVLWIGIGGSSLGPLLLKNALKQFDKGLNFYFLDNVDPDGITDKLQSLKEKLRSTLFVVVSKSGGTPEPRISMQLARQFVETNGIDWPSQAIAITMPDSNLDNLAIRDNWLQRFEMQDWVGGRTSITSSVGLLALALLGINIRDFLRGASIMDQKTRVHDLIANPAALMAFSWYLVGGGKGLKDMVILPYKDRLDTLSRYLQQLVMESLGKKFNRQGNVVNQGLSVYGNKGSTDQHAYVQQLRDGIDNFFVTFIEVLTNNSMLSSQDGYKPEDYLSGFLQGTRSALTNSGRQNVTITIKSLTPFSLGALIGLFERTVGLYAEMIDINAYDQPGVEAGKIAASDVLSLQSKIQSLLSDFQPRTIKQITNNIPDTSLESIFYIVRHLAYSNSQYLTTGDWSDPESISVEFKLNN